MIIRNIKNIYICGLVNLYLFNINININIANNIINISRTIINGYIFMIPLFLNLFVKKYYHTFRFKHNFYRKFLSYILNISQKYF